MDSHEQRPSSRVPTSRRDRRITAHAGLAALICALVAIPACERSAAKPSASADMEKRKKSLVESMDKYAEPEPTPDPQSEQKPEPSPATSPDSAPTPTPSP